MTRKGRNSWLTVLGAAALLMAAGGSMADDSAASSSSAPAADSGSAASGSDASSSSSGASSGDSSGSGGGDAAPAAPPVKPMPSEIEPLTPESLVLSVVNDGAHLVAVGGRGAVIVSNNGKDWAQVQTPVRSALTSVYFTDANNGWAVGHDAVILHTTDGGKTWTLVQFKPALEKPFLQVIFTDAGNGYAVGAYGLFEQTTDGGQTWTDVQAPSILADQVHLNSITKLGDGSLLIAGEQGLLGFSSDAGKTWSKLPSVYDGSFFGGLPLGQHGALIYGLRGNVFITDDVKSGKWTKLDVGTVATFFGGTTLPNGDIVLVGLAGEVIDINPATKSIKPLQVMRSVTDNNGKPKLDVVTSTLSSVIPWGNGILVTGTQGVQTLANVD